MPNSEAQVVQVLPRGLRVVFVFHMLELGGAERQAMLLAKHLADKAACQVEVVGFCNPGRLARLCEENGFAWRIIPASPLCGRRRFPARLLRLTLGLRKLRPDVLMPYTIAPNVMCGALWRFTGARTCIWNQRDESERSHRRWLERLAVRQTPRFIANSRGGARFLTETLGADPGRVLVIRNGVRLDAPKLDRAGWRAKLAIAEDAVVCTMVANLQKNKDHETLLRAWRFLIDSRSDFAPHPVLLLAGRPAGTEDRLLELARELGISEGVRFLGPVDDIAGLLEASDIGVHSSPAEGCPNSVLEFMLAGLPVVGTDIEGIRDVVGEESYPLLAPVRDAEALADRIRLLVDSADLRARYGSANAKRAVEEFSPQVMCERMTSAIAGALGK